MTTKEPCPDPENCPHTSYTGGLCDCCDAPDDYCDTSNRLARPKKY